MNSASQLLRALAIIGALAAGALFYLNGNKMKAVEKQSNSATTAVSADALKEANDKLAAAEADKAKMVADLKNAKDDAALAESVRNDAVKDLDAATKKARDAQNALDDKETQIADLTKKAGAVEDLSTQLKDLKEQNTKLQNQVDALAQAQTPTNGTTPATGGGKGGKTETAVEKPIQLAPAAPAKILQIDTKQWLLVLDVGTNDANVKTDTQLQLKVGNEDLGTVVVRDNAAGMATAAIVNTGGMSEKDYARILTRGLNIEFQRVIQ